jgi:hypothetical protein
VFTLLYFSYFLVIIPFLTFMDDAAMGQARVITKRNRNYLLPKPRVYNAH